jgi:GNAT superfamily N-acetyltransferase
MTSPADNYPKDLPQRDALTVSIRPLAAGDEDALLAFFGDIPEHERFFLKDDVTSPDLIRGWIADAERPDPEPGPTARTAGRAFVLIALNDGRIVGEAALVRRRGKARSHLADVRVVVAQDVRHHGLGTALISELCDVARDTGLSGVLFEAVEEAQAEALAAAEALGFTRLGRVYGGAIDPEGRLHDVVLLAMPVRRWRTASYF